MWVFWFHFAIGLHVWTKHKIEINLKKMQKMSTEEKGKEKNPKGSAEI
jgi:hypothetical protein